MLVQRVFSTATIQFSSNRPNDVGSLQLSPSIAGMASGRPALRPARPMSIGGRTRLEQVNLDGSDRPGTAIDRTGTARSGWVQIGVRATCDQVVSNPSGEAP